MIASIKEIRGVTDPEKLFKLEMEFHEDLTKVLSPLKDMLDKNLIPTDQTSLNLHMGAVEAWRYRIVRLLSVATAFVEHAKSEAFLKPKEKGVTDIDREAHKKHMYAGFQAEAVLLEGLIGCIDSRINLCKKLTQTESDGFNYGRHIQQPPRV